MLLFVGILIAEDEHDVVWFWLTKDEPHECPVCSQYFVVSGGLIWCDDLLQLHDLDWMEILCLYLD